MLLAVATSILAAIAGIQAYILATTDASTRKAAEAAITSATTAQRQLKDAEIQEAASITIRNLTVNGFPENTVVSYDVLNTGRTRANQVTIDPGNMTFPAREEMSVLTHSFGGRTTPSELGITIDPSDPPRHFTVPFGAVPQYPDMPPEERKKLPSKEDIKSGRAATAFYVIGTYSDVFGNKQHVADCVIFHGGAGFKPCFGQQNRHY